MPFTRREHVVTTTRARQSVHAFSRREMTALGGLSRRRGYLDVHGQPRAGATTSGRSPPRKRGAHDGDRRIWVAHHERCGHTDDAVARPDEMRVPSRIEPHTVPVHPAIHLHHDPRLTGGEVHDEATDDHLAPERDAQAPAAQLSPEPLLRRRLMPAHVLRASFELALARGDLATLIR